MATTAPAAAPEDAVSSGGRARESSPTRNGPGGPGETVLGVQALHGSQEWTPKDMAEALSQEALTAATMQRYHVDVAVNWALGAKLGTLRDKTAA